MFAMDDPCSECVILHNNWMSSAEGKAYRFKEFLMWAVDEDGYYTDANAKYITYSNPIDFGKKTPEIEIATLRTAMQIGYLLNRSVILPKFHCYGCQYMACDNSARHCSLNTYIKISTFDRYMKHKYREHMFLENPKVPQSVLISRSPIISVRARFHAAKYDVNEFKTDPVPTLTKFTPEDQRFGASSKELLKWLEPYKNYSIMQFHSMYGIFKGFSVHDNMSEFEESLRAAIVKSNYRQKTLPTK